VRETRWLESKKRRRSLRLTIMTYPPSLPPTADRRTQNPKETALTLNGLVTPHRLVWKVARTIALSPSYMKNTTRWALSWGC